MPKTQPAATVSTILTTTSIPAIGTHWLEQGGIYAGILRGENGQPDSHLIAAPPEADFVNMIWQKAVDSCALAIGGFTDWHLPDRRESRLAAINIPEFFEQDDWYWTSAQGAADSGCAWLQGFSDGNQLFSRKSDEYRARAVRRFSIIQ